MLTQVRIQVEEQTVGEVVDALARYEAAITTAEAQRFDAQWPHEYTTDPLQPGVPRRLSPEPSFHWDLVEIPEYDFQLGRELVEEVIEFDSGLPGWKGRRVVRYRRLDGREHDFVPIKEIEEFGVLNGGGFTVTGTGIGEIRTPSTGNA